jgi:8-oxo-dGTP diphosphatase
VFSFVSFVSFVPFVSTVTVVAAVIEQDDRFLLTLRPAGSHLAGHWEFPGGKVHAHETHAEALRRELHEELHIVADVGELMHQVTHAYPEKTVSLYFYRCGFRGEPKPMMGQDMRWVSRAELADLPFPDADLALIRLLSNDTTKARRTRRTHEGRQR